VARRRFLADEVRGTTAAVTGQNAAHLGRVLRARIGQQYEIAANGSVCLGTITSIQHGRVEFTLGDQIQTLSNTEITLLAAIFKFDRFEWAIEKATELGVARIVPVIARRTDARLAQAAAKRVERWRRIAHEASQQSRRIHPPEITEPIKLKDAITTERCSADALVPASELKILLAESEEDRSLRSVLEDATGSSEIDRHDGAPHLPAVGRCGMTISLAVGPEGGWTDDELKLFRDSGWISASLGPTILRAETATIAALAITSALIS